ncbi:helix-turn-helix domain-containing protein [Allopontixanthobacter sp.]|uniref:helix-turn-helix domain-containing protein n=1 Tax=Allopontixanthobacter sp. TaxID=2906452 RepID=UPI002ABA7B83|nr:helix-turn-helix domain-containing protein [Allopontixanthobacter sp.]MDZ4308401.1 helix-turn-helix domain-containing protein [Allopontixanthobacter sp.]
MTRKWTAELHEQSHAAVASDQGPIPIDLAMNWAVWEFAVSRADLVSKRRQALVVLARSFVVWAMRNLGEPRSYADIGAILGGRDSSSIIHLHQKALAQRLMDSEFAAICTRMRSRYARFVAQSGAETGGADHG